MKIGIFIRYKYTLYISSFSARKKEFPATVQREVSYSLCCSYPPAHSQWLTKAHSSLSVPTLLGELSTRRDKGLDQSNRKALASNTTKRNTVNRMA